MVSPCRRPKRNDDRIAQKLAARTLSPTKRAARRLKASEGLHLWWFWRILLA
jgi:hypothetical protein